MKPNPGECPRHLRKEAIKIRGKLRNGMPFEGWQTWGRGGCIWALDDHPFSIVEWEIMK